MSLSEGELLPTQALERETTRGPEEQTSNFSILMHGYDLDIGETYLA
jgi:hypothetical protein